ncbi:MAG: hypothetical protein RLZ00_1279, partial [Pseudomonadota bacterium]
MNSKTKSLQALLDQGIALQHAGDNAGAKTLFEQALKTDATNAVANYSLSAIASAQGQYTEALAYVSKVLRSSPQFAQAHMAHSVILFHLGRMDESLAAVQKAL